MVSRVVKLYILIVLVIVSILPTIYFLIPNFKVHERQSKDGSYHFIPSEDGYELFVRSYPVADSLPSLIFLADNPLRANAIFQMALGDSLKNEANLFFPDYRSIGKSERSKSFSAFNIENYARDLLQIINKLDIKNTTILAHGFGALVAQYAAQLDSTAFEKLIMISPISHYDKSAKRAAARLAEQFKNPQNENEQVPFYFEMHGYTTEEEIGFFGISKILASMEYYKSFFVDSLNADILSLESIESSTLYTNEELMAINLPSLTIGLLYSLYKNSSEKLYRNFPVESHIIFGESDVMIDRNFFKKRSDFTLDSIPNASYFPYVENKSAFLNILRSYL